MEFKSFGKIENISKMYMSITQKIHGSNGQIYIFEEGSDFNMLIGSRTRWITPDDDNYGFAKFCLERKDEIINLLGPGRHFGEWAGPGINAGEGLAEKTFFLFNWQKFKDPMPKPPNFSTVPVLYTGKLSMQMIESVMDDLKTTGSRIAQGYMKPEGIVIKVDETYYKKTFDKEEIDWSYTEKKEKSPREHIEVSHLLHPLRLEKLLSRDEKYMREFPSSLRNIVNDYTQDLLDEKQIESLESIKAGLPKFFAWIKHTVENKK